jgi:hypothetical protein
VREDVTRLPLPSWRDYLLARWLTGVAEDAGVARWLHRRPDSPVRVADSPANAGGDEPARGRELYRGAVGVVDAWSADLRQAVAD